VGPELIGANSLAAVKGYTATPSTARTTPDLAAVNDASVDNVIAATEVGSIRVDPHGFQRIVMELHNPVEGRPHAPALFERLREGGAGGK
jgi:hypothetical protein